MKKAFWKSDGFAGLLISLLFLFASNSDLLQSLERKAYDLGVRASTREPGDKVAVIAIDDRSIANIGRWPWPRGILAEMTSKLAEAQAKVIGNTIFFTEAQVDPGLAYINRIAELTATMTPSQKTQTWPVQLRALKEVVNAAQTALDNDGKLADSLKHAGNVVLAMPFTLGEPLGKPDQALPDYVQKNAVGQVVDRHSAEASGLLPLPAASAVAPVAGIGRNATAIGHLNAYPDVDGAIRTEPLVLRYYDHYYPSLALQIVARYLNLKPQDIQISLGEGVKLGNLNIVTDGALQMNTFFYADREGKPAFTVDSFYDVYSGNIPLEKYRGKIVLIGATATGLGANQVTPVSPAMAPVLTLAHSVASLLNEDFFISPPWSIWAERAALLLVALYLMLLLPRLNAAAAALTTALLLAALLAAHFMLMTRALWLQLMAPAALLLIGHTLLTTKRFLTTERGKAKSEAESAESNRNLGLMLQGQGQLDMAFERFRKCPADTALMELLYNLALDFERKRHFNKAEAVFGYMAEYNPQYKDLEQRTIRARAMAETVMLGGAVAHTHGGTLILNDGTLEKPMLGRYRIEKELGKGAMGVVYLGSDPKISRVVAIKTMGLSAEFDAEELAEVKRRFFHEAKTAGRLNHPNIVTIYDAGEEHDLCYIAMELLSGKNLAPFTHSNNLLPLASAVEIVAKVADALDYAHSHQIVHRDIKPANIMYETDGEVVKVTDFGIARITDSSRTKTGMVLGTPSYMSPEQLSGNKVDGRSDLFSLGVMLYQLLSGKLPFQADSMAALMYTIANQPHQDILTLRPELPPCLSTIINRLLEKDVDKRYQRGHEVAVDLRSCMNKSAA